MNTWNAPNPFQREVARLLAANRNPESHIADGAVINRGDNGLRISDDLDIFHDTADSSGPFGMMTSVTDCTIRVRDFVKAFHGRSSLSGHKEALDDAPLKSLKHSDVGLLPAQ